MCILPALADRGHHGIMVSDTKKASEILATQPLRLAFVELGENTEKALNFLSQVGSDSPDMPIIGVGPLNSVPCAVQAMRAGAGEYITHPINSKILETLLENLLPNHEEYLAAEINKDDQYIYRIAGQSAALMKTIDLGRQIACSSIPVLISGESGTGKELIAYLVHS